MLRQPDLAPIADARLPHAFGRDGVLKGRMAPQIGFLPKAFAAAQSCLSCRPLPTKAEMRLSVRCGRITLDKEGDAIEQDRSAQTRSTTPTPVRPRCLCAVYEPSSMFRAGMYCKR
eukprot:1149410-Rhodomonas_salina.1